MDVVREKMSAESFDSRQPPLEQPTELVTQQDESQGVNTGIYIPTSEQEVISRNSSLREADATVDNEPSSPVRVEGLTSMLESTSAASS